MLVQQDIINFCNNNYIANSIVLTNSILRLSGEIQVNVFKFIEYYQINMLISKEKYDEAKTLYKIFTIKVFTNCKKSSKIFN